MDNSILKKSDFDSKYFPKIPVGDIFYGEIKSLFNLGLEQKKIVDQAYEAINNDFSKFIEKPIDVRKIHPNQKFLNFYNLQKIKIRNNSTDAELVRVGDEYYILDGHHRIAREILSGEKIVLAKVYEPEINENMNIRKIVKGILRESFIDSDGELKDFDFKLEYPYEQLWELIEDYYKKNHKHWERFGWSIFDAYNSQDISEKYNSHSVFRVEKIDEFTNWDNEKPILDVLNTDEEAYEKAKEAGFILDEYGVVLGLNGVNLVDKLN